MSKPVKVYNKGIRPIVYKRDRTGTDAIHPGKFLTFNAKKAGEIIKLYNDACSEDDFKEHIAKKIKELEAEKKKTKTAAKK